MHLKSLRLSGFKSFVEPTVLHFPDALCGVVGPNGCGKSNIVDALRWVMGATSSQSLRGSVMADVIFNGSAKRKPLGLASVEMVLDNEDGAFGGAYSKQREIIVRREIARSGEGSYFLNGMRVRRRDVLDLFMDSGLGPGSYGIIEQSSVTRLAEARPEELRVFLEEAAGIARYRERRRETLQRLERTRENMARLTDLRSELSTRLKRLAVQARQAGEAREVEQAALLAELRLSALQYREFEQQRQKIQQHCTALSDGLAQRRTGQQEAEKELREMRAATNREQEQLRQLQAAEYAAAAAVSRLEQSLQRCRELAQRYRSEQHAEQLRLEALQTQDGARREELTRLRAEEAQLKPAQEQLEKHNERHRTQIEEARVAQEIALRAWEEQGDKLEQARSELERARFAQQDKEREELQLAERAAQQRRELQSLLEQIRRLRSERAESATQRDAVAQKLAQLEGEQKRLETLRADQQRQLEALRQSGGALEKRLAQCRAALETAQQDDGLPAPEGCKKEARRIVEQVEVTPGWEQALDLVLGYWLEGWSVENFAALREQLAQQQGMCILAADAQQSDTGAASDGSAGTGAASDAQSDTGTANNAQSDTGAASGAQSDTGAANDAQSDTGAANSAQSNTGAASGAQSNTGAASGAQSDTGAASNAQSNTGAANDAQSNTGAASGAQSNTGAASGAQLNTGAANGAQLNTGAASGAQSNTGAASGAQSNTGMANNAQSDTAAASGAQSNTGAANDAQSDTGAANDAQSNTAAANNAQSDTAAANNAQSDTGAASDGSAGTGTANNAQSNTAAANNTQSNTGAIPHAISPAPRKKLEQLWLGDQVRAPAALLELLRGVYAASSLEQAWQLLPTLAEGESVITRSGVWLSRHWLRSIRPQSRQGLLQRRRQQRRWQVQLREDSDALAELEESRQHLEQLQRDNNTALGELTARKVELWEERTVLAAHDKAASAEEDRIAQRWQLLRTQRSEARAARRVLREKLAASRRHLKTLGTASTTQEEQLRQFRQQREESTAKLAHCQGEGVAAREELSALHTRQAGLRERLNALQDALQQVDADSASLGERVRERHVLAQQEEDRVAREEQELQQAQEQKTHAREQLQQAQQALKKHEQALAEKEHTATHARDETQRQAEALEEARIKESALQVRYETVCEQLTARQADATQLLQEMPAECTRESLQRDVERLQRRRKKIGVVNPAALEEQQQEEERSAFLEKQYAQLEETLDNLGRAMAHIDREIRTRFKSAYEAVNTNLQNLFPRLFGGGRAHLVLEPAPKKDSTPQQPSTPPQKDGASQEDAPTAPLSTAPPQPPEDDPLQARLQLLAQPPGKRTTRVQLLSGGEKVLTAIALMFALFHYRPAPFCVLDEVDAPLDDSNVRRYTQMLEELSTSHQFLFITHNKVSMEVAQRLIGVTMSEPGVSRLVEVSLEDLAVSSTPSPVVRQAQA